MIKLSLDGGFEKTEKFMKGLIRKSKIEIAEEYAEKGLKALKEATPKRTGKTAASWTYEIKRSKDRVEIQYINTNIIGGENIAILIQMGHGTKTGGYVRGRDYINPALKPVFSELADKAWKEMIAVE